jgi:RND family efflux transporter MFP subunit
MKFNRSSLLFALVPTLLFVGPGSALAADPAPPSVSAGGQSFPTISVEAAYPGADSQVVADTVAAPIEQQVLGTEGLLHMYSRSAGDGTYVLHLTFRRGTFFRPGTDLDGAQVLVQNRVALALPVLPDAVQRAGVTVKQRSPCPLMLAVLFSPDTSHDVLYLGNYATIQIRDELGRLPGVADVAMLGAAEYGMQVWLDPEKMAARNLTAADIISAIEQQNVQVATGRTSQTPDKERDKPITLQTTGRLASPEEFGDLIVKASDGGRMVRLKDVARVELGTGSRRTYARLDGKPVVTLAVFPIPQADPREVSAAVGRKLAELRMRFPPGIALSTLFDFTARAEARDPSPPGYLAVEADLPSGASPERTQAVLDRCRVVLLSTVGVQNVLELSETPFGFPGSPPCLLVRTAVHGKQPDRKEMMGSIRARLVATIAGAEFRLCDLTNPNGYPLAGFPVDLAISGPDAGPVRDAGQRLIERLRQSGKLLDVGWDSRHVPAPQLQVEVDRTKAATLGVPLGSVFDTLQVFLGSRDVGQFSSFGRTCQVRAAFSANDRNRVESVGKLKVRSSQGNMVPLATLATIRETPAVVVCDRLNGRPMVEITANPVPGISLAEARWLCEKAAEEIRQGSDYQLTWLADMPSPKPIGRAETLLKPGAASAPPVVAVVRPVVREIEDCVDCTGRTQAVSTVDVRARVTGYLDKAQFQEGSDVKKGTVLFEIDSRPYQAEVAKAEAEVHRWEARRERAQAAIRRAERLIAAKAMSQEEFELLRGELEDAQGSIGVARASLDLAKLNLDFSKVVAPLDGRIGRCLVTPGNLVKADETLLATIVSRDPMFVYFDLDERTALRLMRTFRPPAAVPALMGLPDEEGYPRKGTVDFVDNRIDADTGTLKVRAVFPNAGGALVPGLFVRVRLLTGDARKALLVPEQAIQEDQGERFLYVVDQENKVVRRELTVGTIQDGLRVVEKGLQPGERVVVRGLQMALPGMTVTPRIQEGK